MRNKALEEMKKSSEETITITQAADVLGLAYIKLIQKLRRGEDVGFMYSYVNDHQCSIPRQEFIIAAEDWRWTAEKIKMISANFLSIEQAANAIGCAERTLRKEINSGKKLGFDYFQMGGIWRINKKSFIAFMEGK